MSDWRYDPKGRAYTDPDGTRITPRGLTRLRDRFADLHRVWADGMARLLTDRTLTVQQWEQELQDRLLHAASAEYLLGRGGAAQMQDDDWIAVATVVRAQFDYLHRFAEDVRAGRLTADQIAARSQYYFAATIQLFERAHAAAWGLRGLPAWPGDGQTPCLANCRCYWQFRTVDGGIECTWVVKGDEEMCGGCDDNAARWDPFFLPASTAVEV